MIYKHFSQVPLDLWLWKNFSPDEPHLACRCCGEFFLDPKSMDLLQRARDIFGRPLHINSGHRCEKHNSEVGGAKNSQHLKIAFDVALGNYDRYELLECLKRAGFTTFGLYKDFIHTDIRPNRRWYGLGAEAWWELASF